MYLANPPRGSWEFAAGVGVTLAGLIGPGVAAAVTLVRGAGTADARGVLRLVAAFGLSPVPMVLAALLW